MVTAEVNADVTRIECRFPYSETDVAAMNGKDGRGGIRGRRWEQNGRFWELPLDLQTCRKLRELYGDDLKVGRGLNTWAKGMIAHEQELRSLHVADDANLERTPEVILKAIAGEPMPELGLSKKHALSRKRDARPYQRADIRMMAQANVINANQPGTGKTLEAIGAMYESGLATGEIPHMVIAPRRSLVNVWQAELQRFSDLGVYTSEDPKERKKLIDQFLMGVAMDESHAVICLIADDLRLERYYTNKKAGPPPPEKPDPLHACKDYKGNWYKFKSDQQRRLFMVEFGTITIDEFHKTGLNTRTALFNVAVRLLNTKRIWPMSGTPIGGKTRRLWPVLNAICPDEYTSEWRWIEEWLVIEEEQVSRTKIVKKVGDLRADRVEDFDAHHSKHLVRRLKRDALPGLPAKVMIEVETPMTRRQKKLYETFEQDAEVLIDGKRLSGSIILAQYTRLRQLANSVITEEDGSWVATNDSGKLEHLLQKLDENGVRKVDPEPGARAYVGTVSKPFAYIVAEFLREQGIACDTLTGDTKDSQPLLERFEGDDPEPYVIVMTTQTGGVSLNMESADSAHALDESWDPDEMVQFWDRGDRGGRETPLRCYVYRTPGTIQEYIAEIAWDKALNNKNVLDFKKAVDKIRKAKHDK